MNRRDFLTVLGGASVASLATIHPAFAAEPTTSLYLDGLMMLSFEDSVLRIGMPKAPGHNATVTIVPKDGSIRTISLKGNGILETKAAPAGKPAVPPEVVRISEIYGKGVKARFEKCPHVIEIPYGAIKSISASQLTRDRWTFVRADNGQEIDSFRPRQVADVLRLELLSSSVLKLDGKTTVALAKTQEIHARYAPNPKDVSPDMIIDHFAHYMQYIDTPPAADFIPVPKKVTGFSSGTAKVGNRFMMIDGSALCFFVAIGA